MNIPGYVQVKPLGCGQFGQVILVKNLRDQQLYAAKVLHSTTENFLQNIPSDTTQDGLISCRKECAESKLLQSIQHPNIIKYVETVYSDNQAVLIMEFAKCGDLEMYIHEFNSQKSEGLTELEVLRLFVQIAHAIAYLHQQHIIHRDIKPKNILLDGNRIAKVTDFGVSKTVRCTLDIANTNVGTPLYMAPEILDNCEYNAKCDVWSLGCVLYELMTGSPPFRSNALGALVYQILHNQPPPLPNRYSSPIQQLCMKMLSKDPKNRPSMIEVLSSQVIQQYLFNLATSITCHHFHEAQVSTPILQVNNNAGYATVKTAFSDPYPNNIQQVPSVEDQRALIVTDENNHEGHKETPLKEGLIDEGVSKLHEKLNYDSIRQIFMENHAAALRNKARVAQEQSGPAVFLDSAVQSPIESDLSLQVQDNKQILSLENRVSSNILPPPPSSIIHGNQNSSHHKLNSNIHSKQQHKKNKNENYERLLEDERRRIRLETKALHLRMQQLQTSEDASDNM